MFRVFASTGDKPFATAQGFTVGVNYIHFLTPQKEDLIFHYRNATPTELIRWCENRLNNATNTKNTVKII